jgi:hypothetical protein
MDERVRQELTKLRRAPEPPQDLWDRVREGPRVQEPPVLRRTRALTIVIAMAVTIPAIALAWIATRPLRGDQVAQGELGVVDVPALGEVAPANLADGRPVFVVHHDDGTVEVIDAFSTHVPWGLAKLVAWCPTSRTFDDVFHGAKWNEDGAYILGPAPTGLATYRSTIVQDGRVLVGPAIPPAPRPSSSREAQPPGPFCTHPATAAGLVYATLPTAISESPADVAASAPSGWVAVRGSLIEGGASGAELCALGARAMATCAAGAPVDGIDVGGLFGPDSGNVVVSGTFITRVHDGALLDITRVPEPQP